MPSNVEIKAKVSDPVGFRKLANAVADNSPEELRQEDVFFNVPNGRLKLRCMGERGELIFYIRPQENGPRLSQYQIEPIERPLEMRMLLRQALGEKAVVRKTRQLFLAGRTRIHLDSVEGLGCFMELEVVLGEKESEESGRQEATRLMKLLEIKKESLINCAYVDLLTAKDTC